MPPAHDPALVPAGVSCIILTGRLDYRGSDRVDITRQGNDRLRVAGKPTPGDVLAPSSAILWPARRALDAATTDEQRDAVFAAYRLDYLAELRTRYCSAARARLEALLEADYQTLVCFCTDPRWCHRVPAAQSLASMSRGRAIYFGEAEPLPSAQMRLICVR